MIRFYSLFISDENLLSSPYIQKFNFFHDVTLHRGKTETVNFLLQTPLTQQQENQLNIISDPMNINLIDVEVKTFKHQTLVSITLAPKEVGTAKIGLAFPQSQPLHFEQLRNLPSQLVSTPVREIQQKKTEQQPTTAKYNFA